MNKSGRKALIWIIAAAAIIAVMFAVDPFIPDIGAGLKNQDFLAANYELRKLGTAVVAYREKLGKNPQSISDLENAGLFKPFGVISADSIEYFPEASPDCPPFTPSFWTKKPLFNDDSMNPANRGNFYFIGYANGMFEMLEQARFESSFKPMFLDAIALLKSDPASAERYVLQMLQRNDWARSPILDVECACYRLGESKSGHQTLRKAFAFAPPEKFAERYFGIRYEAARALAFLGDDSGVSLLNEGLLSPRYNERMRALSALTAIGKVPDGYDPLMDDASRRKAAAAVEKP